MTPQWRFRAMTKGEPNVDPVQAAFFAVNSIENLSEALVRETIQNSLDAQIPGRPVRVRFVLSTIDCSKDVVEKFVNPLLPHVKATPDENLVLPNNVIRMRFLLVEDFGTRGLQGDPEQDEDVAEETGKNRNDFYYFWRNVGRSDKSETDRGRWGLGKVVYSIASEISAFYGLTSRITDNRSLLLGQCVLKIHKLHGTKFSPYGYYGQFEEVDGNEFFALPIEQPYLLSEFRELFGLERDGESGLSIVVPFARDDISAELLRKSVIHQYFYPILAGDLSVEVVRDGISTVLDSESIRSLIGTIESMDGRSAECMRRLFDLSSWAITLPSEEIVELPGLPLSEAPSWDKLCLPKDLEASLRTRFEQGDKIALQIPIKVQRTGEEPVASHFEIFLQRDEQAEAKEEFFIRQGITITGIWSFKDSGVRGLVVVADRPLSALLGDAENPAHTDWQQRSPKFSAKYAHGPSCVGFVKKSLHEIIRKLSRPPESLDTDLLKELFYVEKDTLEDPTPGDEEKDGMKRKKSRKDVPTLPPPTPMIQVRQRSGGFSVSRHERAQGRPDSITIEVAYETRRGNPFKQYSHLDFELNADPIRLSGKGVGEVAIDGNRMTIPVTNDEFSVVVTGFDENRDLRIRATPMRQA